MSFESLLVIKGPIADISFEILQLMLILHTIYWFIHHKKPLYSYFILIPFIMHLLRFIIYFPFILQNTNNLIISGISLCVILYYILSFFEVRKHKLKLGLIYASLAIYHFIYQYNDEVDKQTALKKVYYFIPFTNMLSVCSWEFYDENIFPFIFGDYLYHLIDIIVFFHNNRK